MLHVNIKCRARTADLESPAMWDPTQDLLVSMVKSSSEVEIADGPYILEGRPAIVWREYCFRQAHIRMVELLKR